MKNILRRAPVALALATVFGLFATQAQAQIVVNDTLTGAASTYNWIPLNGACLTAGDSSSGTIKGCLDSTFTYYTSRSSKLVGGDNGTLPDAVGKGALRLTNGDTTSGSNGDQETGAVVSADGFPMDGGVNITWTSVTYGGDGYGNSAGKASGADGISFFLSDYAAEPNGPTTVGGSGGSLGYSCSNTNGTYNGVRGGYLGVGIDEFGNFSNGSGNTSSGRGGAYPGTIALRGAGDTNWYSLNASTVYGKYYPTTNSSGNTTNTQSNMAATCKGGYAINYSGKSQTDSTGKTVAAGATAKNDPPLTNYKFLVPPAYPAAFTISNQEAIAKPRRTADPTVSGSVGATPITYNLSITKDGLLTFAYSINSGTSQTVFSNFDIVAANGLALPAKVRFGFSAGTGGGSNIHEITCFKAAPNSQSSGSAGSTAQPTTKIPGGAQIYIAYYNTNNWYGTLSAYGVDQLGTIATSANWEANCVLTGSTIPNCAATPPAYTSRNILSYNDSTKAGVAFALGNLSSATQTALGQGDSLGANRVKYLSGDRTNEKSTTNTSGTFRLRTGVMGDIIDSSPTWVGPPLQGYTGTFSDVLNTAAAPEGATYAAYQNNNAARTNYVFVGANDGMMHAFRAGSYSASTATYGGTNDGAEMMAYVPAVAANTIHTVTPTLDYSSPSYSHNFYVDGTPGTGDLYYGGTWHTWVVAGLGAGGQATGAISDQTTATTSTALFGLEVPSASSATTGAAIPAGFTASNVLFEVNPSTISCVNVTNCGTHLGLSYGTPQIRRMHNGNWAVLFGNGLNSQSGTAGMFVMVVDSSTGGRTFYYYDTGAGPTTASPPVLNGITQVTPVDLDGDHVVDYVYAGDLLGNVWRFDVTSATTTSWAAGAKPLFTTSTGRPITTGMAVAAIPTGTGTSAKPRVVVAFGTGQKLPMTVTSGESYASATQALYGVWDWDMTAWNSLGSSKKFDAVLASTRSSYTIKAPELVTQTLTTMADANGNLYRTATSLPVCWADVSTCGGTLQMGWTTALQPAVAGSTTTTLPEQVIFNPTVISNEFQVNTYIPSSNTTAALSCSTPTSTGFTMALQMANGGASSESFLPLPNGTFSDTISVVGLGDGAVGTSAVLNSSDGKTYIASGTGKGGIIERQTNYSGGTGKRLNWTKVR